MTSALIFLVFVILVGTVVLYMLHKRELRQKLAVETLADATAAKVSANVESVIESPHVDSPLNMRAMLSFSSDTYTCLAGRLFDRVSAQFPEMQLISEKETYGFAYEPDGSATAYRCVTADGLECFLSWKRERIEAIKWTSENFELEPEADGKIETLTDFNILYKLQSDPKMAKKAKELYATLKGDINATLLTYVKAPHHANVGCIYHIEHKPNGEVRLDGVFGKVMPPIPIGILNQSYNFGKVKVRNSEFNPMPEDRVKAWRIILEDGGNLCFLGDTGTGKTKLVDHILSEMGENVNVLFLNMNTIRYLKEYPTFLKEAKGEGQLLVVFDEAQHLVAGEHLDILLHLMAGNQTLDGVSFILSMNAKREELPPALIRDGRVSEIVELGQLSSTQGAALAAEIIRYNPDRMKLGPELDALCKKGDFTIANIWALCPKRSVAEKVLSIFSKKKM